MMAGWRELAQLHGGRVSQTYAWSADGSSWIELAPGRTLTGLAKKINRRLAVDSFATAEPLTAAKA